MLDRDLARLYGVETKTLKQSVRRNAEKFPNDFLIVLSENDYNSLILNGASQNVIPPNYNIGGSNVFAFTEQGISMLATVIRSKNATIISIQIMRAFVAMRHYLVSNAQVFQRLDKLEYKQLEADHKFEIIFNELEKGNVKNELGVYFDGQIFDAYVFVADLIKRSAKRIVLLEHMV